MIGTTILIDAIRYSASKTSGHFDTRLSAQMVYENGSWAGVALVGDALTPLMFISENLETYVGEDLTSLEFSTLASFLIVYHNIYNQM